MTTAGAPASAPADDTRSVRDRHGDVIAYPSRRTLACRGARDSIGPSIVSELFALWEANCVSFRPAKR